MIESADPRRVASKAFNSRCRSWTVIAPMSAMAERISNRTTVRVRRLVMDTDRTKRHFFLRRVDSPYGARSRSGARCLQNLVFFANLKYELQSRSSGDPNRNRTSVPKALASIRRHLGDGIRYSRMRYSVGDRFREFPLRFTVCSTLFSSTSDTVRTGVDTPFARRMRAFTLARSSPRSKGLLT